MRLEAGEEPQWRSWPGAGIYAGCSGRPWPGRLIRFTASDWLRDDIQASHGALLPDETDEGEHIGQEAGESSGIFPSSQEGLSLGWANALLRASAFSQGCGGVVELCLWVPCGCLENLQASAQEAAALHIEAKRLFPSHT